MNKSRMILGCLLILGCLTIAGCPAGKQSGEVKPQKFLNQLENSVFEKINDYRRKQGLNPLIIDERIMKQAREHSRNMAENRVGFSHEGFNERVQNMGIDYLGAAENIAYNHGMTEPAETAVAGWIKSEGHRKNIEGNFNRTGIGVVRNRNDCYFTQIFILTSNF